MQVDVVVVGGGHAGCEAAAASARLGRRTALVTLDPSKVGMLSCNPAIGGLAKGHLVRELDALGGLMARVADATCVQFRRLNTRKGLAVQSSRAQVDVHAYPRRMRALLAAIPNLQILGGEVRGIRLTSGRVSGLLVDDEFVEAPVVILTTGTFLGGILHCGDRKTVGGRIGDGAAHDLSHDLVGLGLRLGRLKTGTVPRLRRDSIAWDRLEQQEDIGAEGRFSFADIPRELPPLPCFLTHTNEAVHAHIRGGLDRSPMFTGAIEGRGPRYCPSIEDKIVRFPDRQRHLLFLEPEGHETDRVYVNGLSTSLPRDVQDAMVHGIEGLEDAEILQYGYAVEYDFADPRDLDRGLQHRKVPGLYLAGQLNGTSGYEEAAVQGFIAGVSAARGEPLVLGRDQAYIGVLVDDLITRGVGGEPYRMFPSRAEHRLLLREDNADQRLLSIGRDLGLVDDACWSAFEDRRAWLRRGREALATKLTPSREVVQRFEAQQLAPPRKPITLDEVLRRPHATWAHLRAVADVVDLPPDVARQLEIDVKYEGYIRRAERRAKLTARADGLEIPHDTDWSALVALSTEVRERLTAHRPTSLGALSRLPGITPAAVDIVAAWLVRERGSAQA